MASKPKIARKKNAYQMPKKLPTGSVLQDTSKQMWVTGPSIGTGGFGEIYSATKMETRIKNYDKYPYVVKIEPHGNGPLFVEMHFYMRNAKPDDIEAFKKKKRLKDLGMPYFVGSGSHELEGEKHRFVVMPRYGRDIWSLYLANDKKFPLHTVYRLALQMLDVLEYIHDCTYVHADLKGANMLMQGDSQVFLVDFGLAAHYTTNKDYKPDPKKMHNGTIEYTSRDAHNGVLTMRGDIEILAYNLLHWSGMQLPWEKCLTDPTKVQEMKEKFMKDPTSATKDAPQPIGSFIKLISTLKFNQQPDYDKYRKIFEDALKATGHSNSGPLDFATKTPTKQTKSKQKKASSKEPSTSKPSKEKTTTKESVNEPMKGANSKASNAQSSGSIFLETPKKGQSKKIYQFNIDLDVSIDADVVINVNRKEKKTRQSPRTKVAEQESSPEHSVDSKAEGPERSRKRKHQTNGNGNDEPKVSRREQLNIPKVASRAGEYKGKKAK